MSRQEPIQEEDWLIDDEGETSARSSPERPAWPILIIDDEPDVYTATRLALQNIRYKDRGLALLHASSAQEGYEVIAAHPDIALILLDVVMETDDAGLKLVERIRSELGNQHVRIVLRTGQPGLAPEQEVILNYDIDDYKTKTELTEQKLFTTLISSLRAYENLQSIEKHRLGLTSILNASGSFSQLHTLKAFALQAIRQIDILIPSGQGSLFCVPAGDCEVDIIAATGIYAHLEQAHDFSAVPELKAAIDEAFRTRTSLYRHPCEVMYIESQNAGPCAIHLSPPWPLELLERNLLEVFCQRVSAAYDHHHLYQKLNNAHKATVIALADLAEFRDTETGHHVLRVQQLTEALARELHAMQVYPDDLTPPFIAMIGLASILHDVGKIGTPDSILFKQGILERSEREIMQQHATIGALILQKAANKVDGESYLTLGTQIAASHHEHFDGQGYPAHLKGEDIPLAARIVAVVDVFDALLNRRPYKEPWSLEATMKYITERSGSQFDPHVVTALTRLINEKRLQPAR
jgi:response regulator RpfG family c-di-GMP phosphodiesterase